MDLRILSIDTTSRRGGVCLLCEERIVCQLNVDIGLKFSEKLLEMIDFLLRASQLSLQQLDLLAVTTGPGSFTGLRVGIATSKALATALRRPLVGVTTLEALAASASETGLLAAFMDARRHQVFAALFQKPFPGAVPRLLRPAEALPAAEWIGSLAEKRVKFIGDGALLYRHLIERAGHSVIPSDCFVAAAAGRLAFARWQQGEEVVALDLLDACYVRPADAEIARREPRPSPA